MRIRIQLLFAVFLLISCHSQPKKDTGPAATNNWTGPMQNMAQDVKKLLPFLYDREAYRDPKNHEQILGYLREFAQAAHHVSPEAGKPFLADELLIQYSIKNLQQDLNRSAYSFHIGQKDFSRNVAKSSLSHCFRCHTVTGVGGSAQWDVDVSSFNLQPLEKADLLVATRKYDQAMTFMESLLTSSEMQKHYAFDYESLLRRYLALMIRIENAPQRALEQLNKVLKNPDTPHYILEQAEGWRKSLKEWSQEKKVAMRSADQVFKEVDRRFRKAETIQHYEKDHAGDVEFLRATSLLHQNMKLLKRPQDEARALFFLGKAYEVLDELGSWNLHESYYESCLLRDPHSEIAKTCYNRLEASLYMGYSGSAGTHLPPEERDRLIRLKEKLSK